MTDDDLTTIAAFHLPAQAAMAQNALAAAGIPALVTDAEIVAMDWLLAPAVGGIKVQVRAADADRAASVINSMEAGTAEGGVDEAELTRQALAEPPETE